MSEVNRWHSPEVRERAVRLALDHQRERASQWAAIESVAGKIGCSAQTLCSPVRQAERDLGKRDGPSSAELQRVKELEREVRELRRAKAFFARAELKRRPK
jgi:transposase-like protein